MYGKVAIDDPGVRVVVALTALHARRAVSAAGGGVRLPTVVFHRPDLGLLVFDEVAGAPVLGRVVMAELRAEGHLDRPHGLTAMEGVARAAGVAALLHDTPIQLAHVRTVHHDVTELLELLALLEPLSEPLATWLVDALHVAVWALGDVDPVPPVLSHGDFSHSQLLFDGTSPGLIDFDTICISEPGRDLGHFTAHLQLLAVRALGRSGHERAEALCGHFLDTYFDLRGVPSPTENEIQRVAVFELVSLVRIAAHSWHKLKSERLSLAVGLVRDAVQRVGGADPGLPQTDGDHR